MNSTTSAPYIVVLGNEKGGTGKSTAAMHIVTSLLRSGHTVGTIDVDARQGTLSRYVENRRARRESTGEDLPIPDHVPLFKSGLNTVYEAEDEEKAQMDEALKKFQYHDFIVIDTPGSDSHLSRLAHSYADTLITPLNDSFVDLDMLVRVASEDLNIIRPSTYSEMVWDQKKHRAIRDGGRMDWIVMRNRLSNLYSRNKEEMERVLSALSKRIGFRMVSGFGERVIFRELFLNGLTLLDLKESKTAVNLSHIAAKQELKLLMDTIQLPTRLRKTG